MAFNSIEINLSCFFHLDFRVAPELDSVAVVDEQNLVQITWEYHVSKTSYFHVKKILAKSENS